MKITKFLDHGNLELYSNNDLCSFVNRVLLTGSECQSIGFIVSKRKAVGGYSILYQQFTKSSEILDRDSQNLSQAHPTQFRPDSN